MSRPMFSVVIPTRNRVQLLREAIRCALAQDHSDFEVIVSDNQSDPSAESVVSEFKSDRLRYCRTSKVLHMPDSWDFALEQARGEYITFLADDDGILPDLLSKAQHAIQLTGLDIVAWPFGATYYHASHEEPNLRNTFIYSPIRPSVRELHSQDVLNLLMECKFCHELPRLINSCAHRSVFEAIRSKMGRVFLPAAPDYAVGTAQLMVRDRLAFMTELVSIWGQGKESIGVQAAKRGEAATTFLEELKQTDSHRIENVPLSALTTMNHPIDTVLRVLNQFERRDVTSTLDRAAYYAVVGGEIMNMRKQGTGLEHDYEELQERLGKESVPVRLRAIWQLRTFPGSAALTSARQRLSKLRHAGHHTLRVRGDDCGFDSMFGCTQAAMSLRRVAIV